MAIIDLQRRLREAGRIRIGEKVPTRAGGQRPSKLDRFRFTSSDEQAINAIAGIYGGTPQPWKEAPVGQQWELYCDSTVLDVIVPPVELAWSQFMELWSGGICRHRCDRQTDLLTDSPCSCEPDNEECKPTSRLGVILSAVSGIGIWRLESHGWFAAQELNGAIEVLRVVQNRGAMVPARLLLEQRQQKRIGKDSKPETLNFAVPVLDLQLSVAALTGATPVAQIAETTSRVPYVTPIPQAPAELSAPSVNEQLAALEQPKERKRRANSAEPLPSSGVKPRTVDDASANAPAVSQGAMRRLFALLGGKGLRDDDARHKWASEVLGREVTSFTELSAGDVATLSDAAEGKQLTEPEYHEEPF